MFRAPHHVPVLVDAVVAALRERGCALCLADVDDEPAPTIDPTARFGYLRLRRAQYDDDALRRWADAVAAQPWDEAYVFFKHEDEGTGPAFAARFREIASAS